MVNTLLTYAMSYLSAAQDSTVSFVSFPSMAIQTLRTTHLPLSSLLFVSDKALVGAGYDFVPFLFGSTYLIEIPREISVTVFIFMLVR